MKMNPQIPFRDVLRLSFLLFLNNYSLRLKYLIKDFKKAQKSTNLNQQARSVSEIPKSPEKELDDHIQSPKINKIDLLRRSKVVSK